MRVCRTCNGLYGPDQAICPNDGTATVGYSEALIGLSLGPYLVKSKIGEGGMGVVYEGEHPTLGRKVALKVLRPELSLRDDIVERFVTEARSVNTIGHSNIVNIYDFGRTPFGSFYIVMENLEGVTVRRLLDSEGPQSLERARAVVLGIGAALAAAHAKGFIHRDVKPENIILMQRQGQMFVKLLDFGIVKLLTHRGGTPHTMLGAGMGTPQYMSPEQLEQSHLDHRTDIYAMGAVTYEMLVGKVPYPGRTHAEVRQLQLTQTPTAPSVCRIDVHFSRKLDAAILWALNLDMNNRPARMEDFLSAFEEGFRASLEESTSLQARAADQTVRSARRSSVLLGVAMAILALALGAVLVYLLKPRATPAAVHWGKVTMVNEETPKAEPARPGDPDAEARTAVAKALASSSSQTRKRVTDTLARLGRPILVDELVKELSDPDPGVRRAAALALGSMGDRSVVPNLKKALVENVGYAAVDMAAALAELGDASGAERLRKELAGAKEEFKKKYILHALGRAKDRSALAWRKLLDGSRIIDPTLKLRALGYLAALDDDEAKKHLKAAASTGDWPTRVLAAEALRAVDPAAAHKILIEAVDSAPDPQKVQAAALLAQFGDARSEAVLLKALVATEPEVRATSVLALGRLGKESSRGAIVKLLHDPVEEVALGAAVALLRPQGARSQ
jgi:serine/threonine protein kinase/HEAT repeat protein